MKKSLKIFILSIFFFTFTNNVYADNVCDVDIREDKDITSAGFHVNMPICKTMEQVGWDEVGRTTDGRNVAYNMGLQLLDVYFEGEGPDGKASVSGTTQIPVCSTNERRVRAYFTCSGLKETTRKTRTLYYCDTLEYNNCVDQYNSNERSHIEDLGTHKKYYYYKYECPAGFTEGEYGICEKIFDYNYSELATSNVDAKATCTSATGLSEECNDKCSKVEYALECPSYRCKTENIEINACSPSFRLGETDVYCVNPGLPFGSKGYKYDQQFNVRECGSSYATTECGYANILIEGRYHTIDNDNINLALRLWGYHTNARGFEDTHKTGIANRQGDNCGTSVYFMKDSHGNRPNVYEETYKYIMDKNRGNLFNIAHRIILDQEDGDAYLPSYISNPETNREQFTGATFNKIACKGTVGVTCGSGNYTIAFELFFNTLFGNKYMISHLDHLYPNDGELIESIDVTVEQGEDDDNAWIIVKYDPSDIKTTLGDVEEIDCKTYKTDPRYKDHVNEIEKFCHKRIRYYNPQGTEIGREEYAESCGTKYWGCRYKTTVTALCRKKDKKQTIKTVKVKETKPKSSYSVRRYIACGATSAQQEMYAFFDDETPGDTQEIKEEDKIYEVFYKCTVPCNDYSARVKGESACTNEEPYSKTISDPSLSCIVNMDRTEQLDMYDYSDDFGVNTNFCRIYCSDQVEYTLAGKNEKVSGKAFKYDVREVAKSIDVNKFPLSSVVKQKRTCVSEIFSDYLPTNIPYDKIYGLTNEEYKDFRSSNTVAKLISVIANHKGEVDRTTNRQTNNENINQIRYDLYNCNLFYLNKEFLRSHNLYRPSNYSKQYARLLVDQMYEKDRGMDTSKNFSDIVKYNGGAIIAEHTNNGEGVETGRVGSGDRINVVENGKNESGFGLTSVKYCRNTVGKPVCLGYQAGANEDYSYSEFVTNPSSQGKMTINRIEYKYPTDNYALFQITAEAGFYNHHRYQIFPNTGHVTVDTEFDDLLYADDYTYPLDKNAYNECSKQDAEKGLCNVSQTINIRTFKRNNYSTDPFLEATKNQTFTCTIKVEPTTGDCIENCEGSKTLYTPVDPSNPFPNGVRSGSNWDTEVGKKLIEKMEKTSELLKGDEMIEYRITLNPSQINAIKDYNKSNRNYSDEKLICPKDNKIELNNDVEYSGFYYGCKSEFLNTLRALSQEDSSAGYGSYDFNFDGVSKYTKNHPEP